MPIKEYAYKGWGEDQKEKYWYSSAVRAGNLIECSGQGGFNPETCEPIIDDIEQIDQAFKNVDITLKDAGGKGWSQVIRVNTFHVPLNKEQLDATVRNFKLWLPHNHPTWTCVEVTRLGAPTMKFEIQVAAWDEEGRNCLK